MAEANPLERSLLSKKEKLKLLEKPYHNAIALVKSKEWGGIRDKALDRVIRLVRSYQGGDSVNAVFLLGQIKEIIGEADGPLHVIREYESAKKSLQELAGKQ